MDRRRFGGYAAAFLIANLLPVLGFLESRPPLDEQGWAFLEAQRPHDEGDRVAMTLVADGLNFALARRPIGGWEPATVRLYQLVNLPGWLAAQGTFHGLQWRRGGTSKLHSDLATAVFAIVVCLQWLMLAYLLSRKRGAISR